MTDANKCTAFHEAGHAVAAIFENLHYSKVSIIPDDITLGMLLHNKPPKWFNPEIDDSWRNRKRVEAYIIVSFAGYIAEKKYLMSKIRLFGSGYDFQNATDMAMYMVGRSKTLSKDSLQTTYDL